jgi:hypothetical protein
LKPLWSRLLLCDHEPSQPSTVLCFMSLLMSLLPASGEFLSEFPSPRVILSFFPHPWSYRLGWPCQELKLPPASLSGSWGVLGPLTTSMWQPFERELQLRRSAFICAVVDTLPVSFDHNWHLLCTVCLEYKLRTDLRAEPRHVTTPRAKVKRGEVTHRGYAVSYSNPSCSP